MTLRFYYDLLSQPSRALYIFLKMNKIPFEDCKVNLSQGEHMTDEYARINPFQKVPAIIDGNFQLTESVAILRYLSREKSVPDFWYPKESKAQAKVDEYLEWQHINTRLSCAMYFQTKPPKEERVAFFKKQMIDTLDNVENIWLKDKLYLTGEKISVADLLGTCEIEQTRMAGYDPCEGRPALRAWMERVKKEAHPFYEEAHSRLYRIAQKHKGEPPVSLSKL
ncbi:Glutathione S-transferase 1 [Gryllus bimaculatus]|nr:Glutathione S-transferase 1 [Gryllus bimaculatus]